MRDRVVLMFSLTAIAACIDSPRFAPEASDAHDGMILVPETNLVGDAQVIPEDKAGPPRPPDGGKGKGPGADAGPPPPPPDDAGTPPDDTGTAPPPDDAGADTPSPSSTPIATVVPAFWIDAREVSAGQYVACVAAGACTSSAVGDGCNESALRFDHPVNCVTFNQARAYCAWRGGKRVVTNDEWSAAAEGATQRPYPWGTAPPSADRLNACGAECASSGMYPTSDGFTQTAPCGSFPDGNTPNGIFDLAGNVAEWVSATTVRGGSFADVDVDAVANTAAPSVSVGSADETIGFRCASD